MNFTIFFSKGTNVIAFIYLMVLAGSWFNIAEAHNLDFVDSGIIVFILGIGPYLAWYLLFNIIERNNIAVLFWDDTKGVILFSGIMAAIIVLIYKSGLVAISPNINSGDRAFTRFVVGILYAQPLTVVTVFVLSYIQPVRGWMESFVKRELNITSHDEKNSWQPPNPDQQKSNSNAERDRPPSPPPNEQPSSFDPNRFKKRD